MKDELILLTDSNGFFGQLLMPWESLDIDRLVSELSKHYSIRRVTYEAIANGEATVTDSTIIHSSSQKPEYKTYIEDILLYLLLQSNRLVPSFNAVRAHENKGFQELYKKFCGIRLPKAQYFCGEVLDTSFIQFPAVFKETSGFGSVGVHLVRNERDLSRLQKAEPRLTAREFARSVKSKIGYLVKKHALRQKNLRPYGSYFRSQKRFVIQSFIENLQCDYKVVIFQKRAFILKRMVRTGDFRASGSGQFVFEDPPEGIMGYAHRVLRQLDEPYASLDIAVNNNEFFLIEYQNVHFGPYTTLKAPFHFVYENGHWQKSSERLPLERLFADSLVDYLSLRSQVERTPSG